MALCVFATHPTFLSALPAHRLAHLEPFELRMAEIERLVVAGAAVCCAEGVGLGQASKTAWFAQIVWEA